MFCFVINRSCERILYALLAGLLLIALMLSLTSEASGDADKQKITIVLSDDLPVYQGFVTEFRQTLVNEHLDIFSNVITADAYVRRQKEISKDTGLFITVGVKATLSVVDSAYGKPVYSTLMPKVTFSKIKKNRRKKSTRLSAVFLDQPVARQLSLIRYALPQVRRIGVLVPADGEGSGLEKSLEIGARKAGYNLILERLASEKSTLPVLDRIFSKADVLLAVPETGLIDRKLASNILLTSYRYRKPVVAYSQAYVRAGALLAVYSSPRDIGHYTALKIAGMSKRSWQLPKASYSDQFTVTVNRWLARSMGLKIKSGRWLKNRMLNEEGIKTE
ncbi:MAG: hypothetical protein BMS9Abin33_0208 [Gammaproteobacteria bacterium]|nr:MAG: hypothetical protein BMS9Abin33_0208 [Gammaproteobacteria bacterium]